MWWGKSGRIPILVAVGALAGLVVGAFPGLSYAYVFDGMPRPGYLNDSGPGISETPRLCQIVPGAKGYVEYKLDNGSWTRTDWWKRANKKGCIQFAGSIWRLAAPEGAREVSFRIAVPEQKVKKKKSVQDAELSPTYGPYIDVRRPELGTTRINDFEMFSDAFGRHAVTLICENPRNGRGGQGSAVSAPVSLSPEAQTHGGTFLITAAHVVEDCNFRDWRAVRVVYEGLEYPGYVWNGGYGSDQDVATVITSAPVPPAYLGLDAPRRGDVAIAIGTPGGIVGTITQGEVAGLNRQVINLTTPSGHGASGGPVFNNKGQLIGIVVAGNGSLTVAQALPSFCGTAYDSGWMGCSFWPGV